MGHQASCRKDLQNDPVDSASGQDLHEDLQNDPVESASDQVLHEVVPKWREDGYERWDEIAVSGLRQEFMECIDCLESLQNIGIIICGGTGEGKSSLINNCMAAITGSYANVADHGGGAFQVTKKVIVPPAQLYIRLDALSSWSSLTARDAAFFFVNGVYHRIQSWIKQDGKIRQLPLTFSDTRGFSESKTLGASVAAIKACILGKVLPNETSIVTKSTGANEAIIKSKLLDPRKTDEEWTQRRNVKSKASYIFFVADVTIIPDNSDPKAVMSKLTTYLNLRQIREFSKNSGIRTAAFLTMCDKLDPEVKKDVSNLHTSKHVEGKVKAFSKMIDIPESRIFPIMNYTSEITVSNGMIIQTLIALRGCLQDIRADLFSKPTSK